MKFSRVLKILQNTSTLPQLADVTTAHKACETKYIPVTTATNPAAQTLTVQTSSYAIVMSHLKEKNSYEIEFAISTS